MPVKRAQLPTLVNGLKIGIFGGSFNPPHAGHLLVAEQAMRKLQLDQIWWVPTHGNPLKHEAPPEFQTRAQMINRMAKNPWMRVVDLETIFASRYSYDIAKALRTQHAGVHFVFIGGADILSEIHLWKNWRRLVKLLPICAVARPGYQLEALSSPFFRRYEKARIDQRRAPQLALKRAPAWCLLQGPMLDISSTELRRQKNGNEFD